MRADHIDRPVFATNSTGAKVWTATYTPFGEVHTSTGNLPANRFPGQWFQSESGLHQNWMRDYDPTTGRYLEADPLGLVDGASVYGYVRQSPMMWTDLRGEHHGDKWYGYTNKQFQRWFHRCYKQPGDADANKEEMADAYAEWKERGSPTDGRCDNMPPPPPVADCDDCIEATDVVVAGGVAYIIYRCIRMIPSLVPPAWPTIIPNLAVP